MTDMIAKRSLVYGGRRYEPGDRVAMRAADAKTLSLLGRASYAPPLPPAEPTEAEMEAMRAEYEEVTGGHADGRWKAETLRRKIEEARQENAGAYKRRDMRAED